MQRILPDIDTLRKMASDHPDELELLRRKLAQQIIDQAAPQNRARLQGLQFQIDAHCQTAPNPVAACVKISAMMQASFERLHSTLNVALEGDTLCLEPVNDIKHRAPAGAMKDSKNANKTPEQKPDSAKIIYLRRR